MVIEESYYMFIISKSIWVSASHSLKGHPKCGRMHGHNYKVTVTIAGPELNRQGMLMDFGIVKEILNEVVGRFDHMHIGNLPEGWTSNPSHVIDVPFEYTSSENLAKYWATEIQERLEKSLRVIRLEVCETPSNTAIWEPDLN